MCHWSRTMDKNNKKFQVIVCQPQFESSTWTDERIYILCVRQYLWFTHKFFILSTYKTDENVKPFLWHTHTG